MKNMQMYGDSKMVIEWASKKMQIKAPHLQNLLKAIREQKASFETINFTHIYRELNSKSDKLSKVAITLPPGLMEVKEIRN